MTRFDSFQTFVSYTDNYSYKAVALGFNKFMFIHHSQNLKTTDGMYTIHKTYYVTNPITNIYNTFRPVLRGHLWDKEKVAL